MIQQAADRNSGEVTARSGARRLRACFVLSYRAPDYIRGHSIREVLEQCGDFELVPAVNHSHGPLRYLETIRQLLRARKTSNPDIYILGFRGHEIAWLVHWLIRGKPLVIDALLSPYSAMKEEAKFGIAGRLLAPLWRRYESAILHRADAILTDTSLHADYYRKEFSLPGDKVVAVPVGAIESPASQAMLAGPTSTGPFRVLFYGSFLPLHGMDTIIEAAARLADLPIEFQFIGGSPAQARRFRAACTTRGVKHYTYRAWVPFERLLQDEIPSADLCLGGPFGGTPQALRVVTGKASQCLALGKATVIGRIEEDYGFVDRFNCLLVEQGDANALAMAIRWAYEHRAELTAIGQRGQALYTQRLSTHVIAGRLLPLLHRLVANDAMPALP